MNTEQKRLYSKKNIRNILLRNKHHKATQTDFVEPKKIEHLSPLPVHKTTQKNEESHEEDDYDVLVLPDK